MLKLLSIATLPVFVILFYIYLKDKFEREPLWLAITGLLWGAIMSIPIIMSEKVLNFFKPLDMDFEPFYSSFIIAAMVEEGFKLTVLYFLIRWHKAFNEPFDSIVYAVFISLGFAGIENIFYVLSPTIGGVQTGILRAIFSVPAHALFGVSMGYYFSFIKFPEKISENKLNKNKINFLLISFIISWVLHGLYDFFLLSDFFGSEVLFLLFVLYLWITNFIKINKLIKISPFKYFK